MLALTVNRKLEISLMSLKKCVLENVCVSIFRSIQNIMKEIRVQRTANSFEIRLSCIKTAKQYFCMKNEKLLTLNYPDR